VGEEEVARGHAAVTGADWSRLGDDAEACTTWIGNLAFMRMEHGRCAALEAREDGGLACGIYSRRPEICRTLERGSPACAGEIFAKSGDLHRHLPVWAPG
jgi:hypothetical protein